MASCATSCSELWESPPGDANYNGELKMTAQNRAEPLTVGTAVKILNSGYGPATIAEYRGPLGPGGARVYRVRVQEKPWPVYLEVREDQLQVLDDARGLRPTGS